MDGTSATTTRVISAPTLVMALVFLGGVVLLGVSILQRKKMERPLFLGLVVFSVAMLVSAAAMSWTVPWVDVVTKYSSGESENSGE
jgi:peptidoglycan/LPS O-acetylase OafA/YrhL